MRPRGRLQSMAAHREQVLGGNRGPRSHPASPFLSLPHAQRFLRLLRWIKTRPAWYPRPFLEMGFQKRYKSPPPGLTRNGMSFPEPESLLRLGQVRLQEVSWPRKLALAPAHKELFTHSLRGPWAALCHGAMRSGVWEPESGAWDTDVDPQGGPGFDFMVRTHAAHR